MKIWNSFLIDGDTGGFAHFRQHNAIFCKEKERWEFVEKLEDAQIVCTLPGVETTSKSLTKLRPDQILLGLNLFHIDHHSFDDAYFEHYLAKYKDYGCTTNKIVMAHNNSSNFNKRWAYWDIMFYRQQMYFTEYSDDYDVIYQVWTNSCNKDIYTFNEPQFYHERNRNILNPQRIYAGDGVLYGIRMEYRKKLRQYLIENNNKRGFINDSENGASFFPNNPSKNVIQRIVSPNGGLWYPIGDAYYDDSYVSAYVETLCVYNGGRGKGATSVTEKTLDPLCKMHFILPFSYPGLIAELKETYGFKFPDWIDYSYDDIENDDDRFKQYLKALQLIIDMPISKLHDLTLKDIDILKHNRQRFYDIPYISFYDTIMNNINYNGYAKVNLQNPLNPDSSNRQSLTRLNPTR